MAENGVHGSGGRQPPLCEGNSPLADVDPELFSLIAAERHRQKNGIELIASENFTSRAVMECLGSCLTNKYSEGYPGCRYYGGNEHIDAIERLCQKRALEAYHLDPEEWSVNVQPYSGSPANFAAYTGLLQPHDRIMGLDLPSGGHLTHGFYTAKKKVSASSIFFESMPYKVDPKTELLDYDELRKHALLFRPKLIIAGVSAYSRNLDYKRFREICDETGAILLADMAHVSGLVAAQVVNNPFEYCDVVTTTTHKSLRGPRSGMIFINKKRLPDAPDRIDQAVFPALQGGPHNHQIAGVACQLRELTAPGWKEYAVRVIRNSQRLAEELVKKGYKIVSGGTDNHLLLWNVKPQGITGAKMQLVCDEAAITLNKNACPGDESALNPSGVRIGTPAMTTRGCTEEDFVVVAEFLHRCVVIAQEITASHGKKIADFTKGLPGNAQLQQLRSEVESWSSAFPFPGV